MEPFGTVSAKRKGEGTRCDPQWDQSSAGFLKESVQISLNSTYPPSSSKKQKCKLSKNSGTGLDRCLSLDAIAGNDLEVDNGGCQGQCPHLTGRGWNEAWSTERQHTRTCTYNQCGGPCDSSAATNRSLPRDDSGYSSDLDEDGLGVTAVCCQEKVCPPQEVWRKYPFTMEGPLTRAKKRHMDSVDSAGLRVVHPQADDVKLGDSFGAELFSTEYTFQERKYWQHFFTDVQKESPASALKIRGGTDELVLLNGDFMPDLTKERVFDKFKNLPVDSRTPLTMVIRRVNKSRRFEWVSISCILVPEYDTEPKCREVREKKLGKLKFDPRPVKLKMAGSYLCVAGKCICVKPITDERTDRESDIFMMTKKIEKAPGDLPGYLFYAAFRAPKPSQVYIGPDKNKHVSLLSEEHWFSYEEDGNFSIFSQNYEGNRRLYLGREDKQAIMMSRRYRCEVNDSQSHDTTDGTGPQNDSAYNSSESLSPSSSSGSSPISEQSSTDPIIDCLEIHTNRDVPKTPNTALAGMQINEFHWKSTHRLC